MSEMFIYRMLEPGETILESDEYCDCVGWKPRAAAKFGSGIGEAYNPIVHFETRRRVIEPGEGYRILNPGEQLQDTDEIYIPGEGWKPTLLNGTVHHAPFRRALSAPIAPTPDEERIQVLVDFLETACNALDGYDGGFSHRLFRSKWNCYRGTLEKCREIAEKVRRYRQPVMPVMPNPEIKML